MGLYDFMMLNSEEQMAQIMAQGTLVTKLRMDNRLFVLYSLNTFFFELEYNGQPKPTKEEALLLRKHIFSSGIRMEKYLRVI